MTSDCQDHKSCVEMFEKLSQYLDNELDASTCADIEMHASGCISCRVCLETLKRTVTLCKNVAPKPIPASFSLRLKQALEQLARSGETRGPRTH